MKPGFEVRDVGDFERRPGGHGAVRAGGALDFEQRKAKARQMIAEGAVNAEAVARQRRERSTNVYRKAQLEQRATARLPARGRKPGPDLDLFRARAWTSRARGRAHGC